MEDYVKIYIWSKFSKKNKEGVIIYVISWHQVDRLITKTKKVENTALLEAMSLNEALASYNRTTVSSINRLPILIGVNKRLARKIREEKVKIPEHMDSNLRASLEKFNIQVFGFNLTPKNIKKRIKDAYLKSLKEQGRKDG